MSDINVTAGTNPSTAITAVAALGIVAILGVGVYEIYNYFTKNPIQLPTTTQVITSNPITQAAATMTIRSSISSQNSDYRDASVTYLNGNTSPAINTLNQNNPTIFVNPSGSIGTYNPLSSNLLPTASGVPLGNNTNPYNYQNGWQGEGWYNNISTANPKVAMEITTNANYNLGPTALLSGSANAGAAGNGTLGFLGI
jgi:hypothetical protein